MRFLFSGPLQLPIPLTPLSASAILVSFPALSQNVRLSLVAMAVLLVGAIWEAATNTPLAAAKFAILSSWSCGSLSFTSAQEVGWLFCHFCSLVCCPLNAPSPRMSSRGLLHCHRHADCSGIAATPQFLLILPCAVL